MVRRREGMTAILAFSSHARRVLAELKVAWSERQEALWAADIELLVRLIDDPAMARVWEDLDSTWDGFDVDITTRFLLELIFRLKADLPDWLSLTGKVRRKRLTLIRARVEALRAALEGSPIRWLSPGALKAMSLEAPPLRVVDDDMRTILDDIVDQAAQPEVQRGLRRPNQKHAHRRYFIRQLNMHLAMHFQPGMNRVIAELARIVFEEPEIDEEVVRKSLRTRRPTSGLRESS